MKPTRRYSLTVSLIVACLLCLLCVNKARSERHSFSIITSISTAIPSVAPLLVPVKEEPLL